MNIRRFWLLSWPLVVGIFVGFGIIYIYNNRENFESKLLSPLGINPEILASKVTSKKPLIGFLPYWNINSVQIPYHLLDWLAYFSVTLNYDGTIQKATDNNLDMGWYLLGSDKLAEILDNCRKNEVKRMLVISAFNNEVIDTIVKNENASNTAIESIAGLVKEYGFEGVNIDFEYNLAEEVTATTESYVKFLDKLKRELQTIDQNIIISVDLYANGIIKDFPYKSKMIADQVDFIVLMGYDFHQANSTEAGPVAPLKSQNGPSISEALNSAIKKEVDSQKIILAMPFYGYEWQTIDDTYGSNIYPGSGAMASYNRVSKLIKDEKLEPKWDFIAMSPWLTYDKNGATHQIYYENDESIGLKLELIDQVNLGGGAIWALGYEGKDASVWKVVEKWRKNN